MVQPLCALCTIHFFALNFSICSLCSHTQGEDARGGVEEDEPGEHEVEADNREAGAETELMSVDSEEEGEGEGEQYELYGCSPHQHLAAAYAQQHGGDVELESGPGGEERWRNMSRFPVHNSRVQVSWTE